ncbi:hypothetical protein CHH28_14200 [Bacterioplanes sanyensis]|uniref:Uncharacterized protein n=1 Tax=Bacterioplanes sanyensis TaxID=1249553 RepID=A0A222FNF7_9GAMM|nr:hypothetical protein [Bacterioplanes sanyensis]ASP39753.1 hypothetical protein CHH28_14200 [Bacterioplanes sanyensis]
MTRKKKTRSLKRIHNVKTGNRSKLKRSLGNDRQASKRIKGRRTLSVYEKFLQENPEAKERDKLQAAKAPVAAKTTRQPEDKREPEKDLLSQLDQQNFDDIY